MVALGPDQLLRLAGQRRHGYPMRVPRADPDDLDEVVLADVAQRLNRVEEDVPEGEPEVADQQVRPDPVVPALRQLQQLPVEPCGEARQAALQELRQGPFERVEVLDVLLDVAAMSNPRVSRNVRIASTGKHESKPAERIGKPCAGHRVAQGADRRPEATLDGVDLRAGGWPGWPMEPYRLLTPSLTKRRRRVA